MVSVRELYPLCAEEDPCMEEWDQSITGPERSATHQTRRQPLAVLAGVGSMALVVFALHEACTPPSQGAHTGQQRPALPRHDWVQWKQQVTFIESCEYGHNSATCPAWALFHNPEIHNVAVDNLMKVGHGHLNADDRDAVKAAVVAGFKNVSLELRLRAPEVAHELNLVELSAPQKDAVVSAMRLMSDPWVQSIGREVGKAIRDFKSTNRQDLRHFIEAKLHPHLDEIMERRRKLVPDSLRQFWVGGDQWTMTLDDENLRVMGAHRAGDQGGSAAPAPAPAGGGTPQAQELAPARARLYAILGGVLEEGRALLDMIEMCGHIFGRRVKVPRYVAHLGGSMDVGPEHLSCEREVAGPEAAALNATGSLFCPLKFGTQGMDALKVAFDMGHTTSAPPSEVPAPPKYTMMEPPHAPEHHLTVVGA